MGTGAPGGALSAEAPVCAGVHTHVCATVTHRRLVSLLVDF